MAEDADAASPSTALVIHEGWQPGLFASSLGPRREGDAIIVRAAMADAKAVELIAANDGRALGRLGLSGEFFEGALAEAVRYRLRITWPDAVEIADDPYSFGPLLDDTDLYLFAEGTHQELARRFGSRALIVDGVAGVRFTVWAPKARHVAVVGDFNWWNARRHPMRRRAGANVWELFVPGVAAGSHYRFQVTGADGQIIERADPLACQAAIAPSTASIVGCAESHAWGDADWLSQRAQKQSVQSPISIYEVHAGSWKRRPPEHNRSLSWAELADELIPYVAEQGFTHIELLPVMAHPFGGSWGYQPLGLFAPQPDFGKPTEFMAFVDAAHRAGLGVLLDWVPAHFPSDPHGLSRFDGTPLYEHADPKEGVHRDWNTLIYDLGRPEVRSFLISSALHWLEVFHIDGLRVDAVASMLYRDYSRKPGEWIPNRHGGRENLEAIAFLQQLNRAVHERAPDALMIAEESTAWPGVTRSPSEGGLGFDLKWNMGWMNDTLRYAATDPLYRVHHHKLLSFGIVYAFSEHFLLPLSHDEMVHGKRSLVGKMPGDLWQQCANLRAYFGFMWAHPGKKLLFMGGEIAQWAEWNHDAALDWATLGNPLHRGVQTAVRDLNRCYRESPVLHASDADSRGFEWLIGDDAKNSVFAFLRRAEGAEGVMLVICNFTPQPLHRYRIGVPCAGVWRLVFNSDSADYAGSGMSPAIESQAQAKPAHGQAQSLELTLPPLATLYLQWKPHA